jgi:hypothetical protein
MKGVARILAVCAAVAALAAALAANAAEGPYAIPPHLLVPGRWVTTTSAGAGHPFTGLPATVNRCIKAEDVKDTLALVRTMLWDGDPKTKGYPSMWKGRAAFDCVYPLQPKFEDSNLSFDYKCQNGDNGRAEFTFSGDSYEGDINVRSGGDWHWVLHTKAKRVGDC